MGILLAVLVLAALSTGFLMMALLPLGFMWLAFSIFKEPWATQAPVLVSPHEPAEPMVVAPPSTPQAERPRVMAAGRRRPL